MWPLDRRYKAATFEAGRGAIWSWGLRTYVMGIVNATHDSFSGDGVADEIDKAVTLAKGFEACGVDIIDVCLLYTSPSPRDRTRSRMPSSA